MRSKMSSMDRRCVRAADLRATHRTDPVDPAALQVTCLDTASHSMFPLYFYYFPPCRCILRYIRQDTWNYVAKKKSVWERLQNRKTISSDVMKLIKSVQNVNQSKG